MNYGNKVFYNSDTYWLRWSCRAVILLKSVTGARLGDDFVVYHNHGCTFLEVEVVIVIILLFHIGHHERVIEVPIVYWLVLKVAGGLDMHV